MVEKKQKSILQKNNSIREKNLQYNNDGYGVLENTVNKMVGGVFIVDDNVKLNEGNDDILYYTHGENNDYSQSLHNDYGVSEKNLKIYAQNLVKPSFTVNEYDGFGDYMKYIQDVYGREESYAGHLMGLLDTRDLINDAHYETVYAKGAKTFADTINEIMQYYDVKSNMGKSSVGIVRNIDVSKAINGVITTNVNNYDNKDTKLGMITNQLYAQTLLNAAEINSFRRTKYLTPSLENAYGNNMNNIYRLSTLFLMNDITGRINDVEEEVRIENFQGENLFEYLKTINEEFQLPSSDFWEKTPKYNDLRKYFSIVKQDGTDSYVPTLKESTVVVESADEVSWNEPKNKVYSEGNTKGDNIDKFTDPNFTNGYYSVPFKEVNETTLLHKTNKFLKERRVNTIISRFYDETNRDKGLTQTAVSKFGISHGRNLLTRSAYENKESAKVNGYDNPYCRVWTNHHQYAKMKNLVRPFYDEYNAEFVEIDELQDEWIDFRTKDGARDLSTYGVLNKNGMVNITPSAEDGIDVKKCMFSIENLAWKDVLSEEVGKYRQRNGTLVPDGEPKLSEEQRGPNGGRIMWFPPYDLNFQEVAQAKWNQTEFIGRGEPVFTYNNSSRSGTLSFTLLVDNPSVLNYWMRNKENSEDNEQTLLRYFAGCEPLSFIDEKFSLENSDEISPSNEPVEYPEGKDIVFYVFYPNNFSGADYLNDNTLPNPMAVLFGGDAKGATDFKVKIGEEMVSSYLGYEMGNHGMSLLDVNAEPLNLENAPLVIGDVFSVKKAIDENIKDGVKYGFYFDKERNDDGSLSVEKLKKTLHDFCVYSNTNPETLAKNKSDMEEEKQNIQANVAEYDKRLEEIKTELAKIKDEYDASTVIYNRLEIEKKKLLEYIYLNGESDELRERVADKQREMDEEWEKLIQIEYRRVKLETEQENTEFEKQNLLKRIQNIDAALSENSNQKTNVEAIKHSIEERLVKGLTSKIVETEPIYFYIDDNGNYVVNKESAIILAAVDAKKMKKYIVSSESEKPSDFIFDNSSKICRAVVKDTNKVVFWEKYYREITLEELFIQFKKKTDFKKSKFLFGCDDEKKKFWIKDGSNIKTYEDPLEAFKQKPKDAIKGYLTMEALDKSKELYGSIVEKLYILDIQKCEETDIIRKLAQYYTTLSPDEIVKTYFYEKNKIYCELEGVDYGMVQYFIEKKVEGMDSNVETLQECINTSVLQDIEGSEFKNAVISTNNTKLGDSKTLSVNIKKPKEFKTSGEREYFYPHDKKYERQKKTLQDENLFDTQSFGLNSTFERVKKEMGDESVTFSFAEVYAALISSADSDEAKWESLKEHVITCEIANLKQMFADEEELKTKIAEVTLRLEYLKNLFTTTENSTITAMEINGYATKQGHAVENNLLSKNRRDVLDDFIRTMFGSRVSDIETTGTTIPNTQGTKNISELASKKGRCAKIIFTVGEKDVTNNSRNGNSTNGSETDGSTVRRYKRYDDEKYFFKMLESKDPAAYKRLVDKVKYFSPAFHSITPEGFNARLTFLHQCTRQGPTATSSDVANGTTAANLAFGRAPFCVLRLGDFLNTKIVIDSVDISYPEAPLDLNPEGIGVQYMLAKVTMRINIIGGSDISAPIKRLQNAVSFNYYANTSVYDNRSDRAFYSSGNTIVDDRQWFA